MTKYKLRLKIDDIVTFSVFMWSITDLLAYASMFGEYAEIKTLAAFFGRVFLRIVCFLRFVTKKRTRSEVITSLSIVVLAEVTNYFATTRIFIPIMYILAIGNDIDDEKLIDWLLRSSIVAFLISFLSSLIGIVPLYNISLGVRRYVFGFRTANTCPAILFQIATADWFLDKSKKRIRLSAVVAFVISYWFCKCRTASLLSLSLVALEMFWSIAVRNKDRRLQQLTWKILYATGIVASFVSIVSLAIATKWVDAVSVNTLLSGRIVLMQRYYSYYGLTFWGQKILTGTSAREIGLSTLDNAYVYLLLSYGLVMFLIYVFLFVRLMVTYKREKKFHRIAVLLLYALYGFSEVISIRFVYNFSLLFFKDAIWRRQKDRSNSI